MIEGIKIHPDPAMSLIERMRREDMKRYADPATGLVREDISIPVKACPACGDPERSDAFQKEAFAYVRCHQCGCVYVERRLNDKELGRLYGESGRSVFQMERLYIPTAAYRMDNIYRRKAKALAERVQGRRLLDFGCSAGFFMKAAEEFGWEAHGVETNEKAVRFAREELGLANIHKGGLEDSGFGDGSFDAITLWDVVEHIPDPVGLLECLRPYLKPSGLLVLETSHIDCLETDYLGPNNTNIVGDMHLMHFTLKSVGELVRRAGYETVSKEIFGMDVDHIINYHRRIDRLEASLPHDLIAALQAEIDRAGRGCYLHVELAARESRLVDR